MSNDNTATLELFIIVDQYGEYEVGPCEETARERFDDNIGGNVTRMFKLDLTVPLPEIVEVSGTLRADDGKATLTIE